MTGHSADESSKAIERMAGNMRSGRMTVAQLGQEAKNFPLAFADLRALAWPD